MRHIGRHRDDQTGSASLESILKLFNIRDTLLKFFKILGALVVKGGEVRGLKEIVFVSNPNRADVEG